jgi:hypothetical protein
MSRERDGSVHLRYSTAFIRAIQTLIFNCSISSLITSPVANYLPSFLPTSHSLLSFLPLSLSLPPSLPPRRHCVISHAADGKVSIRAMEGALVFVNGRPRLCSAPTLSSHTVTPYMSRSSDWPCCSLFVPQLAPTYASI